MTQIQIRIEEIEFEGRKKMTVHIDNMRADTATAKEKEFCDLIEKLAEGIITDAMKNVTVMSRSSWPKES